MTNKIDFNSTIDLNANSFGATDTSFNSINVDTNNYATSDNEFNIDINNLGLTDNATTNIDINIFRTIEAIFKAKNVDTII